MRDRLHLRPEQVATVASWARFNEIVEHTEGATSVNAGQEVLPSADHQLLNTLQKDISIPWDEMRHDAFTFRIAMGTAGDLPPAGVVSSPR
jgi:hypothetical protein